MRFGLDAVKLTVEEEQDNVPLTTMFVKGVAVFCVTATVAELAQPLSLLVTEYV